MSVKASPTAAAAPVERREQPVAGSAIAHSAMANAIRALAMDAVEQAKSGHPGMPMGMADVATILFTRFLKFSPGDPAWPDRDRFVLSAGHGSMLIYALLYLTGYEAMTIDQIKRFRQLGSNTAGHPEYGHTPGVETTTGPLGQGLANSVGMAIAEKHGLFLLEDCAHAHGGRWRGRGAGSIGHAGSFSFQTSKLMTAGEGGIVITSDIDLADQVIRLTNCGRPPRHQTRSAPALGHNYRMTEFQAALLLAQFERLEEQTALRERNTKHFENGLANIEGISLSPRDERITTQACYHYVFRFDSRRFGGIHRNAFVAALNAEGIPGDGRFYEAVYRSSLFQFPASAYPAWAANTRNTFDCPVAERAGYEESVWLPHQLFLGGHDDVGDILAAIEKIRENVLELVDYQDEAIRMQALSRAERALLESKPPY